MVEVSHSHSEAGLTITDKEASQVIAGFSLTSHNNSGVKLVLHETSQVITGSSLTPYPNSGGRGVQCREMTMQGLDISRNVN